ncbi:hypothetical protein IAR55_005184 [Kwoniella newhampshirensis]|uniref:Uncharacterized protein n=1 Tax=Kwoniella newhampshirensis TaxID=1651941 RepID=A0AAW0YUZ1_9TREE
MTSQGDMRSAISSMLDEVLKLANQAARSRAIRTWSILVGGLTIILCFFIQADTISVGLPASISQLNSSAWFSPGERPVSPFLFDRSEWPGDRGPSMVQAFEHMPDWPDIPITYKAKGHRVPNIVHYTYLTHEDGVPNKDPLHYLYYLGMRSTIEVLKPDVLILIRPFDELMYEPATMAFQRHPEEDYFCSYEYFDGTKWDYNSGGKPMELARAYPEDIQALNGLAVYFPLWYNTWNMLFRDDHDFRATGQYGFVGPNDEEIWAQLHPVVNDTAVEVTVS